MDRKSIGSFIAVLRKANGLTQKDLAEKLNVSDKSVSRWERDDGTPDLSLVPVLAEIFGVTCDELLRGERQAAALPPEQAGAEKPYPKTDKQKHRILAVSLSRYHTYSLISVGLSVAGLLAAMVGNFGFHRAYIGFLAGAVFYLAAIICQAICINGAFLAVSDDEIAGPEVERFKHRVVSLGQKIISLTGVLLAMSLPLMLYPIDTYAGLTAKGWLLRALLFGLGGLILCGIVCYFLDASLQKKAIYTLPEKEAAVYRHNFNLKRTCTLILLAVLFITLIGHAVATGGWNAFSITTGTSFDDFTTFKAYIEQDIPAPNNDSGGMSSAPEQAIPGSEHYYDEYGNEITKEESMSRTLTDPAGNVVCRYIERNQAVSSVRCSYLDGKVLSITTFTYEDMEAAQRTIAQRNAIFGFVYLLEIAAAFFLYFQKRSR